MASLRERMMEASAKYEAAAKVVSDMEDEADKMYPPGPLHDWQVDKFLGEQFKYGNAVAIRNSKREQVKLYADQLMALRLDQIYMLMKSGAEIPVQRQETITQQQI